MRAKHVSSFLLTLLLITSAIGLDVAFLTSRTFAFGGNPIMWVTPPVSVYEKNSVFNVTIYLNWTGASKTVKGWQLTLAYDQSILSINNVVEGPYLKSSGAPTTFSTAVGAGGEEIGDIITSTTSFASGSGDLVYVYFTVVGNGKVNLALLNAQLLDPNTLIIPNLTTNNAVFYTTYPKASFYYLPSTTTPGGLTWIPPYLKRDPILDENIVFNASAFMLGIGYGGSYDPDGGTITNYRWDFGDNNVTSVNYPVLTHSYNSTGTHDVNLTVTDNELKTDTYDTLVLVVKHDVAVTGITVSPTKASRGQDISIKVNITNLGTYSGTEYVNVTLFSNSTLIWFNATSTPKKSAWSNVFEYDPISKTQPMNFLSGKSIIVNYTWATSGVSLGNYTIRADINLVTPNATLFANDYYRKELDFNLTNNEKTWGGMVDIANFHNLAVTDIALSPALKSPSVISHGATAVKIDVTVNNYGAFNETFSLKLYLTLHFTSYQLSTLLFQNSSLTLLNGTLMTQEYIWNASSLPIGHYDINATASNSNVTSPSKILSIIITTPPSVVITYLPNKPVINEIVQFDASGSQAAPGSSITQYSWRVNGTAQQGTSSTLSMSFYPRAAENISVTVTDSNGATGTGFILIHVGVLPVANFVFAPSTQTINKTVTFDASSSAADSMTVGQSGSDSLIEYNWDFGDGTKFVSVDQNLTSSMTHSFAKIGNFTVTLTVFDAEGLTATITKYVVIKQITSAITLTLNVQTINVNGTVTISGQVTPPRSGVQITILYQSGSGSWTPLQIISSDQSGKYQYVWAISQAGNYTVKTQIGTDDKYTNAESSVSTIQVKAVQNQSPQGGPFDLTPYFVAAVVIIVVIGVAIYVMRRRK